MSYSQEKVEDNNEKALFLQEQLAFLSRKKGRWREETIRKCVLWHAKSPAGYRLLQETAVLSLPSRSTLKRYIGACTGEVVSSLIKQRLHAEVKLHSKEVNNFFFLEVKISEPCSCNSYRHAVGL